MNKNLKKSYKKLRFILGDQLNAKHSWFSEKDDSVLYVIAELHDEATYVKHHIQKLCAFFVAMENFAVALSKAGHHTLYLTLDDTLETPKAQDLIPSLCKKFSIQQVEYQRPDEYRLQQQFKNLSLNKKTTIQCVDTEHFLLPFDEIPNYFTKNKHHKMEFFYRKMRQRFSILMEGNEPLGGRWNYDSENRNKLKKEDIDSIPEPLLFSYSVSDVIKRINKHGINYFGTVKDPLPWPVTRKQSLQLLDYFCKHCLPLFGTFQDAMTCNSQHQWSLYHSRLSFSLNAKMLHPLQVIETVLIYYQKNSDDITLAQVEGFIRQILGWREFVRGVYWANMPEYATKNTLTATRQLPDYFWTGKTKMRCMSHAIGQSLDYAYAHHIQRLMVTGNFCLLTGINPDEVDEWYLGIYIDAIEWVEMPNTRGMSQYADDAIVATKPYTAGGNYINKMSDYCKPCHYSVSKKGTEDTCPFNSLYWNFMVTHRNRLEKNPRIGMVYRNWDKQDNIVQSSILSHAKWCLENINEI